MEKPEDNSLVIKEIAASWGCNDEIALRRLHKYNALIFEHDNLIKVGESEIIRVEQEFLYERITTYMAALPPGISGQRGSDATYYAACRLVHGFALSEQEAMGFMLSFNNRCEPPWSEAELRRKLKNALEDHTHRHRRGYLLGQVSTGVKVDPPPPPATKPPKPEYDRERLASLAGRIDFDITPEWLEARSKFSCWNRSPAGVLHKLFRSGERVVVFNELYGQGCEVWEQKGNSQDLSTLDYLTGGQQGVWFLAQPVTGEWVELMRLRTAANPTGRSRRCEECVTAWRYALLESDKAEPRQWLRALVQWALPIAAIYCSGKRSIHALVRLDAESKEEWDEVVKNHLARELVPVGACPGSLKATQPTRLPGCMREETGQMQQLLYLDDEPDAVPICEKPERVITTVYEEAYQ
jgi:hypothetical protein